ncbi:gliding motility-associated ABC transporter ATP-binding subunit GldA [Psychroflexus salis]|uniref:Gliding motility-associated ABC transporter ATP-binding subunit GldA n=1 Tax=Psychroflexus salis TaxID=1526574 RepID=A0A917A0D8_9FLAO|nr:gliding motility-associated ABC transporter ATP-binding subunit GldA [Psychroflexus salis]GGE19685.1 gliding motility-associated ABC transporter ATP-binding subunit GldA [Psychroflexus salis]
MSIKVYQVSKSYKEQKALNEVSFFVPKGQILGFLGPNGAGKTTLMKILTGYLSADEGYVEINGISVKNQKLDVQKIIGYLPEHNPLYEEMYVKEYLAFHAEIHQISKSKIAHYVELTGLNENAHKKIEQLSKGYRQRVGLAAALLHEPKVLILDEPTTGLDPKQLVEIRQLIRSLAKDKTVMLSTHIMQEVEAICDRAIIINNGKIIADKNLNEEASSQQVIEVEFNYRIEEQALKDLPHIEAISNPRGFLYELSFKVEKDMRSTVFDFAYDRGLKIIQLNKKTQSLENLFIELTSENA